MHPTITSTKNARVKAWLALRNRRDRDRTGLFLIEGQREVERAALHVQIDEFILREDRDDVAVDVQSIYAGTNEIMKVIIARRMGLD